MVSLLERTASSSRPPEAGRRSGSQSNLVAAEVARQIGLADLPPSLGELTHAQFARRDSEADAPPMPFGEMTAYAFDSAGGGDILAALPAAAAVEFTACAATVLDDLQDLDPIPGVNPDDPGAGAELVALLMSLANHAMSGLDGRVVDASRAVSAQGRLARFELGALGGQHMANAMAVDQNPSLEMATDATSAKSGTFGRLAAEVGAALATPNEELISAHGEVGYHLAIADQFQNDVSGIWPGGSDGTDIELGRSTPALIFALEVPDGVNQAADQVREALRDRTNSGERNEERIREALFRSGAVHYAWIVAAVHRAKAATAVEMCKQANPESRIADLLVV